MENRYNDSRSKSFFTGYARELEDLDSLYESSLRVAASPEDFRGLPSRVVYDWTPIENQGSMNSCGGHAGSTAFENLWYAKTGEKLQFSRMYCYLVGQEFSGIRGDRGVTIDGLVKGMKSGCCLEKDFPYPSSYSSQIPDHVRELAKAYKLKSSLKVSTARDLAILIGTKMGTGIAGIPWYESFTKEWDGTIDRIYGRLLGWHAVSLDGYTFPNGDFNRQPYIQLTNSHGTRSLKNGRAWVHPDVFKSLVDMDSAIVGVSDVIGPETNVDWIERSISA